MAVNERPVKDNAGSYIFKPDGNGSYVTDTNKRRVIDHDLDEIADAFVAFARKQGFDFWRS
jgi:type I restriction enzyme M protein